MDFSVVSKAPKVLTISRRKLIVVISCFVVLLGASVGFCYFHFKDVIKSKDAVIAQQSEQLTTQEKDIKETKLSIVEMQKTVDTEKRQQETDVSETKKNVEEYAKTKVEDLGKTVDSEIAELKKTVAEQQTKIDNLTKEAEARKKIVDDARASGLLSNND